MIKGMIPLKKIDTFSRQQKIAVSLLTVLGLLTGMAAESYHAASFVAVQEAAPEPTAETSAAPKAEDGALAMRFANLRSKLTTLSDDAYEPSPSVLNLAYYYPEGADESDVIHSYAGRVYQKLMTKDAQYLADLYDLGDTTPLAMARRLGLDESRVLGKYNPNDSAQSADNPASWQIGRFKNVNISFYDADGHRINEYSNVKDIMAMANVYTYAHDYLDAQAFENYCLTLYDQSHSYKITMGEVYYCSGCLNQTEEDEAKEAIEAEQKALQLEAELAKATERTSGERQGIDTAALASEAEALQEAETSAQSALEGPGVSSAAAESETSQYTESSAAESTVVNAQTQQASVQETKAQTLSETEGDSGAQVNENAAAQETTESAAETLPVSSELAEELTVANAASESAGTGAALSAASSSENESAAVQTGASESSAAQTADAQTAKAQAQSSASPEAIGPGVSSAAETSAAETESAESVQASTSSDAESLPSVSSSVNSEAKKNSYCPGHIDLYVTVTLRGFDDVNGLTTLEAAGAAADAEGGNWQGWTETAKSYAASMIAEDWFERYGLTISAINVRNPLTQEEISSYLSRLPEDVSAERRAVVEFALNSVGKVPYYYGGKASSQYYEGNHFGTVVAPDTRGRVLRGLDCSGWISWVYWSALGQRLSAQSTGTLVGCGKKIQRSELKAGDIIVRTGADAHVVMFLEWTSGGKFIGIHENGTSSNVSVAEMTANYPYYRSLLD